MPDDILWTPPAEAHKTTFLAQFSQAAGMDPTAYDKLHRWSVSDKGAFWSLVWDFCGVIGEKGDTDFLPNEFAWMTGARFFPEAKINLAENLLVRGQANDIAVCLSDEIGEFSEVSRGDLGDQVARVADGLRTSGVSVGDRVAGVLPNGLDALIALLASLSIGAVWTSCSPDFGSDAIVDRIGQVEPKVIFFAPTYRYGGKEHDITARIKKVKERVPSVTTFVSSGRAALGATLMAEFGQKTALTFNRVPFDHPAYVLFTSGTTGLPKAIVHRTGGIILQHMKEHILHGDVRPGDRVIWYTNTAWMMYHWTISALATGATIVLYDGAPILKTPDGLDGGPLWRLVEHAGVTHLGISPKYLATLAAEGILPGAHHNLDSLRGLFVCGAPCLPHQFDWVYDAVKKDMMFASISGGTEILGSFLIGSPIHPVRRGQLTVPALGHSVHVFDDRNAPVIGKRGVLVCTEPFPSMPLTFWGKDGDQRYRDTYFKDRREIWTHGDVAEMTSTGGGYVHGRSDNTLKPGGVRIGISEIYGVCESYQEVEDFLVFGADHEGGEEVVLAIKPADGVTIGPEIATRLRADIRNAASPHHVPRRIHVVSGIPYTINGKRVEGAARTVINGGTVANLGSIANPNVLAEFAALKRGDSL